MSKVRRDPAGGHRNRRVAGRVGRFQVGRQQGHLLRLSSGCRRHSPAPARVTRPSLRAWRLFANGPVARPRTTPRREDPWRAGCGRPIFPAGSASGREQTASTTGPRPSRALPTAVISLERQIQRVSGESWRLQYGANFSDSIDVVRPHSGGNDEKARGSTWSDVAVLEMK